MRSGSSVDRLVLRAIALSVLTTFVAGCMASAAVTVASHTVRTTAKAAAVAARRTMDGAKAVSHSIARPFRKDESHDGTA